jgi:hypothetical protein
LNSSKIIVRVLGGIGNQLYIYSFAFTLFHKYNKIVFLETRTGFVRDKYKRSYQLDNFTILLRKSSLYHSFFFVIKNRIPILIKLFYTNSLYYNEIENDISKVLFDNSNKTIYVDGLWQTSTITDFPSVLRSLFFKNEEVYKIKYKYIYNQIISSSSIAIHVRKLDFNESQSAEYYFEKLNAIKRVENDCQSLNIWLFSDDKQWSKEKIINKCSSINLVENELLLDIEELWLMSLCTTFILGKSTFGYWAKYFSMSRYGNFELNHENNF